MVYFMIFNRILITGASGFIGSLLCERISREYETVALCHRSVPNGLVRFMHCDLGDADSIADVFQTFTPDTIIHCAGIAHQKIGVLDRDTYLAVNSIATENLAREAARINPDVNFIFLSSVTVYGEDVLRRGAVKEDSHCNPSGPYAVSKLDAERRLISLVHEGLLNSLDILRLAPVYDRDWCLNLERRVFAPGKFAYLHFGNGKQRMSALARSNLVEFIQYLLRRDIQAGLRIYNVNDLDTYSFSEIISVFKKSEVQPVRPVIPIPLGPVWLATRLAGRVFKDNRAWWHACYDKLASDLVYDNGRMLATGFVPRHNLETVLGCR